MLGSKKPIVLLLTTIVLSAQIGFGQDCATVKSSIARGKSLYDAGQFLLSAAHFSIAIASDCGPLTRRANWYFALSMEALGETQQVLSALSELDKDPAIRNNVRLFKSYLLGTEVEGLPKNGAIRLKLWLSRNDNTRFLQLLEESSLGALDSAELRNLDLKIHESHTKSPWLAGIASAVLPGAGQAYVGAWQSAGIALVFNALFLGTTIEFANHDLKTAAVASGLIFSVTYIGNIINAAATANQFNRTASAPFEGALKARLFPEFNF